VGNPGNTVSFPNDATFTLGDRVSGNDPANNFQIAELAIWDEILTNTQIQDLANGVNPNPAVIPEPSALGLAALGLLPLGFVGWRRRRR